jgi:hypothetical protein
MICEHPDRESGIRLHRLVESSGIFKLPSLLCQLLRMLGESRLPLIPLERLVEWNREFLSIDLDLDVLATQVVSDFEVVRFRGSGWCFGL